MHNLQLTCHIQIIIYTCLQSWDKHMLTARELGVLNPNNDVSYYALHCPPPLKNRDFVLQRSWLQTPQEVRSTSHLTSVTTIKVR